MKLVRGRNAVASSDVAKLQRDVVSFMAQDLDRELAAQRRDEGPTVRSEYPSDLAERLLFVAGRLGSQDRVHGPLRCPNSSEPAR